MLRAKQGHLNSLLKTGVGNSTPHGHWPWFTEGYSNKDLTFQIKCIKFCLDVI